MSAARPLVTVQPATAEGQAGQAVLPSVFVAPVRPDIVQFVHTNMRKNRRQAYAVFAGAGHQHSASSWGTGRAVSRIPRVSGSGTSRAGQAAFGNMCRSGRMFAPTKTWRRWHRKINVNQKRYAVASALAASAIPALVMARGHSIEQVVEVPCVVNSAIESLKKTRDAIALLKRLGAYGDVTRCEASRAIRSGKGKMRNRRHVSRKGPLVVFAEDNGVTQAFRNLPGVDLCHVDRLNLLTLAPGGHLGRFIIWSENAFNRLNAVYGSTTRESTQKKGYTLPHNVMANTDITRIINSDEVQSVVRAPIRNVHTHDRQKKNPLKNLGVKVRMNPYTLVLRRAEAAAQERRRVARAAAANAKRNGEEVKHAPAVLKKLAVKKAHAKKQQKINFARFEDEVAAPAVETKTSE